MTVTIDVVNDCEGDSSPGVDQIQHWCELTLSAVCDTVRQRWQGKPVSLSLQLLAADSAAEINQEYRGRDYATNVLSFPSDLPEFVVQPLEEYPLGDLVICPQVVAREAAEQQKNYADHFAHMIVHGVLHLCGYDHEDEMDAEIMENLEIGILQQLQINNPYVDRSMNEV